MPRIQHKRGTSANLASVNPTPLAGELVWDSTENAIKIGDGATAWTSLAYVTATPRTHNHDDRYYTETEIDNLLAGKAASSHTHTFSQISDITFPFPLTDNSIVVYTAGVGWGVASAIGTIGVGSQPLGGWPAGSVGASLAGKASTTHASTHATGGSDALSPSDIGAAPAASPAITGNATFEASSGVPVTITNTGTGNSFVVNDASGDATPFLIDQSGRTGIGVLDFAGLNAACDNLVVADAGGTVGATFLGTSLATIAFADGANSSDNLRGWVQYSHNDDSLRLGAGGGARVWVSANGNVGIATGAAAPASALHVNGAITVSATSGSAGSYAPSLTFSGDPNTGFGQVSGQSDTASIFTAGHERVRVDSSGNIEAGPNKRTIGVSSRMHISADNANWGTPLCVVCDSVGRGPVVVSADYSPNPDVGSLMYFNASTGGFTIGCSSPGNSALGSVTFSASQIVTPAGSAAAPAIVSTTGTADSGVYFPAADTFAISTAGSERVRVKSTGAVRFVPLSADPASGEAGDVYYNSSTNKLRVYNGTSWIDLH